MSKKSDAFEQRIHRIHELIDGTEDIRYRDGWRMARADSFSAAGEGGAGRVGWAKARSAVPTNPMQCLERWARCALPTRS